MEVEVPDWASETARTTLKFGGLYLVWCLVHYFTPVFYIYLCVPPTFIGFIMSPFASTMPQCRALRWLIQTSAETIFAMFILFGTWLLARIMPLSKVQNE
jgi:hypothetical protein